MTDDKKVIQTHPFKVQNPTPHKLDLKRFDTKELENKLNSLLAAQEISTKGKPGFHLLESQKDWLAKHNIGPEAPNLKQENVPKADEGDLFELTDAGVDHDVILRENKNVRFLIKNKVNNITLDRNFRVKVGLDQVISSVDLIHCVKTKLQIFDKASSIVIDNSHEIDIYLPWDSKDETKIMTSLSSEVTLYVPESKDKPDTWVAVPLPQQFEHKLVPGQNKTQARPLDVL